MLKRCERLEERAANVYRAYAAASRTDPALCAIWTELARDEEEHVRSLALGRGRLEPTSAWRTWLTGWDEALDDVEARLGSAEDAIAGTPDAQLAAALELEMTELEALRHVVLAACREHDVSPPSDHGVRLADAAERLSDDPQVRLQAALLKARCRLRKSA